jgi:NitT/TauT family transport system substrate-binding protein
MKIDIRGHLTAPESLYEGSLRMRRKIRTGITAGLAMVLVGAISGCTAAPSSGGAISASQGPASLTNVTVGIVPFAPDAVLFYAMDHGIFAKHGLKVTTNDAASPIAISAAMVSGTQQFGFVTTPVLINASIAGTSLKCVAPVAGQVPKGDKESGLIASKASGITTLSGFANKTIAVVQLGSINRLGTQKLLNDAGVKGVKYVAIPFPQMPQALADGRVDGAEVSSPYLGMAVDAGAKVLAYPNSQIWPGGTIYCFAATSDYLVKDPKVAQEFQDAMKEALLYAKDHQSAVLGTLVEHMKLTPKVAAAQTLASNFVPKLNAASIENIQQEMKKQGWVKSTVSINDLVWTAAK